MKKSICLMLVAGVMLCCHASWGMKPKLQLGVTGPTLDVPNVTKTNAEVMTNDAIERSLKDALAAERINWKVVDNLLGQLQGEQVSEEIATSILEKTDLYEVAIKNLVNIGKFLISAGADINAVDKKGRTPLHWAAFSDNPEVADLLISAGADVNIRDHVIKDTFNSYDIGWGRCTPLHWAILNDKTEFAELLINRGADIEVRDQRSNTPLILAIKMDNMEIAKLLIEKGAAINAKDDRGNTPLILAISMDNIEIAKLLIDAGADINAKDDDGKTPLSYAKEGSELYQLLIDNGAH